MSKSFFDLRKLIATEKKIVKEIEAVSNSLKKADNKEEKEMLNSQIDSLKKSLNDTNKKIPEILSEITLVQPLAQKVEVKKTETLTKDIHKKSSFGKKFFGDDSNKIKTTDFESENLKRLMKQEEKIEEKKMKEPSKYVETSNRLFSNFSAEMIKKGKFETLKRDLIKSNLQYLPKSYISVMLFTTLLSFIVSFVLFLFLLFFSVSALAPFITLAQEGLFARIGKFLWIIFVIPALTFLIAYTYPSMEKRSLENKINQELPFATIHMASISGSMVDPTKIFEVVVSTKEYPALEKEFTKLINETNVLGYDLVTALRSRAFNCPSKKLAELYNGLATTINSGGDMSEFFQKRSQSLLFEYKLEREKYTRSAETFMDIYISVVIAAPMILMLLLMMMKISGLGVSLSTSMITLIMVLGVTGINIAFLTFLHLKQPSE